jgi:hypothetical protein
MLYIDITKLIIEAEKVLKYLILFSFFFFFFSFLVGLEFELRASSLQSSYLLYCLSYTSHPFYSELALIPGLSFPSSWDYRFEPPSLS